MISNPLYDISRTFDDNVILGIAQCLFYFGNEPVYDFQIINRLSFSRCVRDEETFSLKVPLASLVTHELVTAIPESDTVFKYKLSDTGLAATKAFCGVQQ